MTKYGRRDTPRPKARSDNCYLCQYGLRIPEQEFRNMTCLKPPKVMEGCERPTAQGWFKFPQCFDPAWKLTICQNFEPANDNSDIARKLRWMI